MASNRLTTYIITFNLVIGLLLFLSSQIILLNLVGYKVVNVGVSIQYDHSFSPNGYPPPTSALYPIPNYPLMIFIIMVIVNLVFYYKIRTK